jgi:hypothetical protein
MDPYSLPTAAVSPEAARDARPAFCWIVLAMGLLGTVGFVLTLIQLHASDPGAFEAFFAMPGARFKLMLPVLYLFGAVMFFQRRRIALVALALHLACVLPLHVEIARNPTTTALTMAMAALNFAFLVGTVVYGARLWHLGRLR